MALNCISYTEINRLLISDYYAYLQYLKELGISYELIDSFGKLYNSSSNYIDYESLEEISNNKNIARAHYKVFEYIRKK